MSTHPTHVEALALAWADQDGLESWMLAAPDARPISPELLRDIVGDYLDQHNPFPDELSVEVMSRETDGWDHGIIVERTDRNEWIVEYDDGLQAWRDQGELRPSQGTQTGPSWQTYWETVGSEDFLAAKALLELSPTLQADAGRWLRWNENEIYGDKGEITGTRLSPRLDWAAWIADVDDEGRGWSSTEGRLFKLVASLIQPDRPITLHGTLGYLGSWELPVLQALVTWSTGGDNRTTPGRARVETTR